jgi:pimeloyl-ACP methyl ester carboxylesterase
VLLFKFDPYLNTFPALLDPSTGITRILFPADSSALEWQDEDNRPAGSVRFEGGTGNHAVLVIRDGGEERRATGLGIVQEVLRFQSAGAMVEGTLFRPSRMDRTPGVVLTHGAGLSSRYNLALEAVAYAAAGVAAFTYDKPGLGRSTGGNWLLLSIEDQVAYVTEAVDQLRGRGIRAVGVWGFSQGGWVAPMAAGRSSSVAFVVMASGAAVSPQQQYNQAVALRLRKAGIPDNQVEEALQHQQAVWSQVNAGTGLNGLQDVYARASTAPWAGQVPRLTFQWELDWWRQNEVDARSALESLRVPLLALFGEEDETVQPRTNVPLLAQYLAASPVHDYTITVLPGANHQFMTGNHYQGQYFPAMVGWVTSRFRPPGGP